MAKRAKMRALSGWLNFDKPQNMSSMQAVHKIRHLFQAQKAGHAGTLDPLATGVLPIALGEATKTIPYLVKAEKEYHFTIKWGTATVSDDSTGRIVPPDDKRLKDKQPSDKQPSNKQLRDKQPSNKQLSDKRPSKAEICAVLPQFCGTIWQKPPAFSALKINGQRAYKLARQGAAVELAARQVHIKTFDLLDIPHKDYARFSVCCGKGTYIRALARDLAEILGAVGHVTQLRRIRVGQFTQKNIIRLDKFSNLGHSADTAEASDTGDNLFDMLLLPLAVALDDIPALTVSPKQAENIRQGQPIVCSKQFFCDDARAQTQQNNETKHTRSFRDHVLAMRADMPVALGFIEKGRFWPARVFNLAG
ncbi:MAG: tRNA pseudouridine(55) synthase TruB [Alphaproteobacteria bacterium]|nr:tRNA pseudouridine(55) synthase TruB [Alphaproteobacteria bacterium]